MLLIIMIFPEQISVFPRLFYKKKRSKDNLLEPRFYFLVRKIKITITCNYFLPVNINAVLWPERFAVSHFHLRHSLIEILQRAIQLQSYSRDLKYLFILTVSLLISENPWEYYSFGRHLPLSYNLQLASYVIVYDYTQRYIVCQRMDCIFSSAFVIFVQG